MKQLFGSQRSGARTLLTALTALAACAALAAAVSDSGPRTLHPSELATAPLRVSVSPFAGKYCGLLGNMYGSVTITDSRRVSGQFALSSRSGSEAIQFSGRITDDGLMRVKGTYSYSEGRFSRTSHFHASIAVALDAAGTLTGIWYDTVFAWYSCL